MSIAWQTAIDELIDGEWHWMHDVTEEMSARADVLIKTSNNIIHTAVRATALERRGVYNGRRKRIDKDQREIRLHPDGLPDPWHPDFKDEK